MMIRSRRRSQALLTAALAALAVRAFAPDGYMPASPGSGLLFELCPDGMPAEIIQALAGSGHHHHGAAQDDDASVGPEQCPIGHMLASAVAHDADNPPASVPDTQVYAIVAVLPSQGRSQPAYRSRAPPA